MKKILITIALAIGSIVVALIAFNATGANASDNQHLDPQVAVKINAQSYETKIKNAADYMGVTVKEAEAVIARVKPMCRANYELEANRELTKDEKKTCSDLESVKLFDK